MINKLKNLLFREELAIRQRLLNLILSVALIGGGISMIATLLMGSLSSTLTVAGILVVVLLSLYLSVFKNKVNLAGGLVVGMSNIVIFPLMYFTSGGMYSGMPIWFVMGLIFTWLTMKGAPCFIMYGINLVAMLGCIIFGTLHPDWFLEMPEGYMMSDILQSIVIVSCMPSSSASFSAESIASSPSASFPSFRYRPICSFSTESRPLRSRFSSASLLQ